MQNLVRGVGAYPFYETLFLLSTEDFFDDTKKEYIDTNIERDEAGNL